MTLDDFQRRVISTALAKTMHDQTHAPPGKLTHPRCPWCLADFPPERIEADKAERVRRGLL